MRVNVQDDPYNATGNGTTNDRDGVQRAIDEVGHAGGGTVYFPAGTYLVDPPSPGSPPVPCLTVPSFVTLEGVRGASTLRVTLQNNTLIQLVHTPGVLGFPEGITIRDLTFQGANQEQDFEPNNPRFAAGIYGNQTSRVLVERCTITRMGGSGIQLDASRKVIIRDNVLEANWNPNLNLFADIGFLDGLEKATITGNLCLSSNDTGISIAAIDDDAREIYIAGNVCSNHRRHGIIGNYGRGIPDGVRIEGNACDENGWMGIYINGDLDPPAGSPVADGRTIVIGNTCSRNGGDTVTGGNPGIRGGININGGFNVVIQGNESSDNHRCGIKVRGTRVVVANNVVRETQKLTIPQGVPFAGTYDGHGIELWSGGPAATARELTVSGNRVHDCDDHGILLLGVADVFYADTHPSAPADKLVVTGTISTRNGKDGIHTWKVWGQQIVSNTCERNGEAGIRVRNSDERTLIAENVVSNNYLNEETGGWRPYAGIYLEGGVPTLISKPDDEPVRSHGVVRGNLCSRMPFSDAAHPTFGLHGHQKHGIRVDGRTPVALGNVTMRHEGTGLLHVADAILGNNHSIEDGGAAREVEPGDGQPDRNAPTEP